MRLTDRTRHLSEKIGCIIIQQICKGMNDLFSQDFVHRDIKLANILVHFDDEK